MQKRIIALSELPWQVNASISAELEDTDDDDDSIYSLHRSVYRISRYLRKLFVCHTLNACSIDTKDGNNENLSVSSCRGYYHDDCGLSWSRPAEHGAFCGLTVDTVRSDTLITTFLIHNPGRIFNAIRFIWRFSLDGMVSLETLESLRTMKNNVASQDSRANMTKQAVDEILSGSDHTATIKNESDKCKWMSN